MNRYLARATERAARAGQRSPGLPFWLLTALFAAALLSLGYAAYSERLQADVGLFTVSYLSLLGLSQAGVAFCAICRLVRAQWAKPYYRLAELSTLAFLPLAFLGFGLIYFSGREQLFYWLSASSHEHLSPWLDSQWLFIRNLLGLLLFYGISLVYAVLALRPDLAGARSGDRARTERQLYLLSPLVLIGFVLCNTLFAWDFAMMLIPHWHSTVFPIFYWFGNLFAGTAALVFLPALLSRTGTAGNYFGPRQIRGLGMLVTCFTLMWLYFYWAQFFVIWFGNLPREADPLWRQMYGYYAPYYWIMMTGCFLLPFAALIFAAVKRSLWGLCVLAAGVCLGLWVSRYLMVVPALTATHRPFANGLDIILALGLLGGFLALAVLLASRLPRYSYWEIERQAEAEH